MGDIGREVEGDVGGEGDIGGEGERGSGREGLGKEWEMEMVSRGDGD